MIEAKPHRSTQKKVSRLKSFAHKNKRLETKIRVIPALIVERYQIPVYVIEPPTPERIKYDIFDRVNRGGTQLNNQEMRNALYMGESTELLEKLSKAKEFKQATGNGIKSVRSRDYYALTTII